MPLDPGPEQPLEELDDEDLEWPGTWDEDHYGNRGDR